MDRPESSWAILALAWCPARALFEQPDHLDSPEPATTRAVILLAVVVAILIVLVALVFTGHACTFAPDSEEPAEEQPPEITYTPDETDYRHIAVQPDTITSFSLVESGNQMYASLSEDENRSITEDLSWLEADNEDVGFLIMNLNTGSGSATTSTHASMGQAPIKHP